MDVVPEAFAVGEPRCGALGQQDFLMHHAAAPAEVVDLVGLVLAQANPCAISGCRDCRAPTRDDNAV